MPGLRHPGAEHRLGRETVALDQRDAVEVGAQDPGGEQAGHASAHDDGVFAFHVRPPVTRGTKEGEKGTDTMKRAY
ncbi:hypothetical protein GCM10029978_033330 [Actinoallomurus acanthiterrae]